MMWPRLASLTGGNKVSKKAVVACILALVLALSAAFVPVCEKAVAQERIYTVVIDAGHGGDNSGANGYGPLEKDITLITAGAMYQTLSQFNNVRVYMTRTTDVSLSLEDRAVFAKSVGADFLFSLHYNATMDHQSYGAEVLVSCVQPYHAMGVQFGLIELNELAGMGMYPRGMKARRGRQGDYYGLIRSSSALGVPSVIVEHCYMDETTDHNRCIATAQQQAFGRADAFAVAKYFGLYSTALGVDYRGYARTAIPANGLFASSVDDGTPPSEVSVSQVSANAATGEVVLNIRGIDTDDAMLYYTYSLDGGQTFASPMQMWPGADPINNRAATDFTLKMKMVPGQNANIVIRARNMFDRMADSAPLQIVWQ